MNSEAGQLTSPFSITGNYFKFELTLAAHGLEELFSSYAVVSVFPSGGK
jgi:hypothetical protein